MSFVKLDEQNLELVSLTLRPNTHFVSSSITGVVTGSMHVAPARSKCIRQFVDFRTAQNNFNEDANDGDSNISTYNINNYERADALHKAQSAYYGGSSNINSFVDQYLKLVSSASNDTRFDKKIDILRFDPSTKFTTKTTIKNVLKNVLMPYHRHRYTDLGFWYNNYNTLNFFNNDKIPSDTCLIYPNISSSYNLTDEFSINFWINPRYSRNTVDYKAGTIFHLSSSISISLVSGSGEGRKTNIFDEEENFKILLQLSQSANLPPSEVSLDSPASSYPNDLIFTSSHFLNKNHWHHVTVSWGANTNNSTGSIFIDSNETKFHIPSSSLNSKESYSGAILGNYFNGDSTDLGKFFHENVNKQGVKVLSTGIASDPTIDANMFNHPLNAEIHDFRYYNKFIDKNADIYKAIGTKSPSDTKDLIMYVPPYFYPDTPEREVLLTPFQKSQGAGTVTDKTNDPFNVQFSFGVGGKMINLENFVRDFAKKSWGVDSGATDYDKGFVYPRLINLVPATMNNNVQDITADDYIYHTGSHIKRNLTILPNDNGLHTPVYDVLKNSPMSSSAMFQKIIDNEPTGNIDYSIVNLNYLIPTSSLYNGLVFTTGSIFESIVGSSPENPGVAPGSVLTIAQRTRDVSSNEIVIYDVSNLYYGNKIHPGSVTLFEENLTGSNGDITIKIQDNGRGGLYRSDAKTKLAQNNCIGNILYDEGILVIKTPHLPYFNKDKVDIKFKGEQNLHTMILNIPCAEWNFTSSSNSSYVNISPTTGANDVDQNTIYITGVNIHDDNFNVIMKANFAQPIFKTEEDEFVIRLKQDF